MRSAKAHLAVVASNEPPSDLEALELCSVGQVVVLPSAHPLASRKHLRVKDLDGEPLVVAASGSPHRTMLSQMFAVENADLQVGVEANGWELMLAFAKYRIGLAVVNDFCPPPRGMKALPLVGAPPIRYHAYWRRGMRAEALDAMVALLEAEFR